jgi:uncharacterized protein (UPF0303 family)
MGEYDELLSILREQEAELQFAEFSNETAWEVGVALLEAARSQQKTVTIDITRAGQQLFHYAMSGTSADNDAWIRRKSNVAQRFGHSSYYMGTYLRNAGQSIEQKYLLPESEYAAHGGAFPLIVRQVGVVGAITVSGLPQAEDHELVVTTLRAFLAQKNEVIPR